jgi:isopenicillin-N epimerase
METDPKLAAEFPERSMERRDFLRTVGGTVSAATLATMFGASAVSAVEAANQRTAGLDPQQVAQDEDFWYDIQEAFSVNRGVINLNNGSVGSCPRIVTDSIIRYHWQQESAPAFQRGVLSPQKAAVRRGLAELFGCESDEIALTRGTKEALGSVLLGLDLHRDDEVLISNQEYPEVIGFLERREAREGIRIKTVEIASPAESADEIVRAFEQAITAKTRLILVSHPTYLNGQLFPIKRLSDLAHQQGIEVAVDGAHSFGQIDFKHQDLDCDYYASSLHKWLGAPKATGMLYVRRDKISSLMPLSYESGVPADDMTKFELGGDDYGTFLSIGDALAFHDRIGPKRKEARLRYMTQYWVQRLQALPNIHFYTSLKPDMSCAIVTIHLDGIASRSIYEYLWDKHHIMTAGFNLKGINGLRMSPATYVTLKQLDYFCEVIESVAANGLPEPYRSM